MCKWVCVWTQGLFPRGSNNLHTALVNLGAVPHIKGSQPWSGGVLDSSLGKPASSHVLGCRYFCRSSASQGLTAWSAWVATYSSHVWRGVMRDYGYQFQGEPWKPLEVV